MKLDEIKALASELNLESKFIKPEEVIFAIKDKGDLKTTFPIPNCSRCTQKCCMARVSISLYDVSRFIDSGLDSFIAGTASGYSDLPISEDGSEILRISNPYMCGNDPEKKDCVFLDNEQKCSIYENRPILCRAFPIGIIDKNKQRTAFWVDGCKSYDLCDNESAFQSLVINAVQYYNENLASISLLKNSINRLKDIGLGKYINFASKRLSTSNRCNNGSV
jgi:Fe-S-cluster containining protein